MHLAIQTWYRQGTLNGKRLDLRLMYAAQKRMQPERNESIECAPSAPLLDCENRRFSSLLAA